jgi:hypothetical protein
VGVAKNGHAALDGGPAGSPQLDQAAPADLARTAPGPLAHEQARSRDLVGRPPRLWNLTGHGKLRTTGHPPPDLPTPVGNPSPHATARDSHSYTQPRRGGDRRWTPPAAPPDRSRVATRIVGGWHGPRPSALLRAGEVDVSALITRPVTAPKLRPLPATPARSSVLRRRAHPTPAPTAFRFPPPTAPDRVASLCAAQLLHAHRPEPSQAPTPAA